MDFRINSRKIRKIRIKKTFSSLPFLFPFFKRLGLITGEIEAGNSNKSLLTELHDLLFKMVRVHLISKNAAAAYYKNIKDTFFTL